MKNLEWAEVFTIFAKYGDYHEVAAEHDEMYAGPPSYSVSPEDVARLEELGWTTSDEFGCFHHFT